MAPPKGFLYGDTGDMDAVAGRLDPQPVIDGRAAATRVGAAAVDCSRTLPGCLHLTAQLRRSAERFAAFFTEAEEGLRAFTSVARGSAADYGATDLTAAAPFETPSPAEVRLADRVWETPSPADVRLTDVEGG